MKRLCAYMAALVLCLLPAALAGGAPNLEGLTVQQLQAVRQEADARIRQMQLPDQDGYAELLDAEDFSRNPQAHMEEKVRLNGELFRMAPTEDGMLYALSPDGSPQRTFLIRAQLVENEGLLLPGDAVTVFGVFEGLSAYDAQDALFSGLPTLRADAITHRLPIPPRLAAEPYAGTREDPAPAGIIAVYEGTYWTDYASFEMEMVKASRGAEALKTAQGMSQYNIKPLRAQEYFLVWLRVKAVDAPNGRANIAEEDFYFVSAAGSEYRHHFLINSPNSLRSLYRDGEQTAILACLIDKGDEPLLVFQPTSTNPLWFNPNAAP